MKTFVSLLLVAVACSSFGAISAGSYSVGEKVALSKPEFKTCTMSLVDAVKARHSSRSYDAASLLTDEEISELMWMAAGFVDAKQDHRTAGSALNKKSVRAYLALPSGVFRYVDTEHALECVATGDHLKEMGVQPYTAEASADVIFVSDGARLPMIKDAEKKSLCLGADAGLMAQNVYLWCAARNIGTVIRGSFDGTNLAALLKLPETQNVLYVMSVGR